MRHTMSILLVFISLLGFNAEAEREGEVHLCLKEAFYKYYRHYRVISSNKKLCEEMTNFDLFICQDTGGNTGCKDTYEHDLQKCADMGRIEYNLSDDHLLKDIDICLEAHH